MLYYKLVQNRNNEIWSFTYNQHNIQYKVGEWVRPTLANSKLFVFGSLEAAKRYSCMPGFSIYSCEVENPTKAELMADWVFDNLFESFWNSPKYSNPQRVPNGTVYCDAVKLIEKVG